MVWLAYRYKFIDGMDGIVVFDKELVSSNMDDTQAKTFLKDHFGVVQSGNHHRSNCKELKRILGLKVHIRGV